MAGKSRKSRNRRPPPRQNGRRAGAAQSTPGTTAGAARTVANSAAGAYVSPYTGNGAGGYANPLTGAGGSWDKSQRGYFYPGWLSPEYLETLYMESGAVRKFIDIPVDDLFVRWRTFTGDDPDAADLMEQSERETNLVKCLGNAMKAGRLYGTGLLVPITSEAPLNEPLDVSRIRPGDLTHFLVFHRHQCHSVIIDRNPFSPGYGMPLFYRFALHHGGMLDVHPSRVLRFDGITPLTTNGFYRYGQEWGLSALHGVLTSIMQAAGAANDITQMVTEANLKVIQIQDLEKMIGEQPENDPEVMSMPQRHAMIQEGISAYGILYTGAGDAFNRSATTFTGLPELMDRYERQMARDADIPATRFSGQSPIGMNSTGESDMVNYAMRVAEQQRRDLTAPLVKLDAILARHIGLPEPPPYRFVSLLDMSEKTQADTALVKAQAIEKIAGAAMLSEDEIRLMLDGDPVFGNLEPLPSFDSYPPEAE